MAFQVPSNLDPAAEAALLDTKRGHTYGLCDILWPLTSEPGPSHDSAGALVLPGLSPVVKDNIWEAVTTNEVTAEVATEVLCPLDH